MRISLKRKTDQNSGRQRLRSSAHYQAPPAFSYRARRSDETLNIGRKLPRDLKPAAQRMFAFWVKRFGLLILLIALCLSAFNLLSLSTNAQVMPLDSGTATVFLRDQSAYQAAADKLLASSIWNHNKITIDTAGISSRLTAQFPELNSVSVTIPLAAHRPLVYIAPVAPALILRAGNDSFVVGDNGRALVDAKSAPAGATSGLPMVQDDSNLHIRAHQPALTSADVSFIKTVTAQLSAKQISITTMTLPAASRELDVALEGKPYFIKFNLQSGAAREEVGTFLATISELDKQQTTPAQYVDVRVPGRAYYK